MNKKPIHILKGTTSLTQAELEKRLLNEKIDSFILNKTKEENNNLFIDLSQVRWINLGAAFQLCLITEKLKKNNCKVYVALPYTENTKSELESTSIRKELKERLKNGRKKANEFLKVINFDKAILCDHIENKSNVVISEDFQFAEELNLDYFYSIFSSSNDVYTPLSDYYDFNYNYIFPLTWIAENIQNYNELSKQIERLLKDEQRGIHHIDILSLKNVILSELIKNLREHSGDDTKYALFSLGLIKSKSISLKKENSETIVHSNEIENNFLKGIIESKINSLIEIYFGDTGIGVSSKKLLDKYNTTHNVSYYLETKKTQYELIRWSFDKWSTSKDEELRGTKGLYRILRIVNKYNGLIHIRSKKIDGGFQKGGKLESEWISNKENLYFHPGTYIQIKLCPQKEVLKYNLITDTTQTAPKKWESVIYQINKVSIDIEYFKSWFTNKLRKGNEFDNLILIFQLDDEELDIKSFFEKAFLQISELRHPKGIILYTATSIGKENLEGIVDSTNEIIKKTNNNSATPESLNSDFENIYDPVLVIGEDNSIFWYGGNQNINNLLDEIYKPNTNGYPKKITQLKSYKKLEEEGRKDILKYLQNESSFFKISNNENILFDFTNIITLYKGILEDEIKRNKYSEKNKKICSPKLDISDNWIYINKILTKSNSLGFALALHSKLLNEKKLQNNLKNTYIFIDHSQQYYLAFEVARLIGIKENKIINLSEDIDFELPRRTKLFNENDNILVLTTVIASSETIRRLVKHIYRDKAKPIAIICLLNRRKGKHSNTLTTWDQPTNIYSIISDNKSSDEEEQEYHEKNDKDLKYLKDSLEKDLVVFSPNYEICEGSNKYTYELDKELISLFERTKSLHYNHFGKYNDRHFTFFLHKDKILKDSLISNKIENKINEWIRTQKINGNYTIVLPVKNNNVLKTCIEQFNSKNQIEEIINLNNIKKSRNKPKNVVFFDFGSITGKTINEIITSNPCKENLLIITVFSQFKGKEKDFYKKIKKIECEFIEIIENELIQTSLFPEDNQIKPQTSPVLKDITVTYITLYDLPIFFYQAIHCPICQHIEALDSYKLAKSKYLKDFSEDRKLRLKIKDYYHIPEIPIDPYGTEKKLEEHEMSGTLINNMYFFKRILDYSISHTESRIYLFKEIYSIFNNKERLIKSADSKLFALIYLLSYEIIWLQKEPLVFRYFRYMIYSLSKYISNYNIEELTNLLSEGTNRKIGFNLATRYKYAAISVFRTSNKFYYCKNIFNILSSSIIDNKIGNNIFQNTLYHINSIHINRYNNSDIYFKDIDEQLEKILQGKLPLYKEQKDAIFLIKYNNTKYRKELEIKNLSQLELFKGLKKEIDKNHIEEAENFESIRIDRDARMLKDISLHKEDSFTYKENFQFKQKYLTENYHKVKKFIDRIILYIEAITNNFEKNILLSLSYKTLKTKYYRFTNIIDEFDDLINKGTNNILHLIENQERYIEYCNLINETFIYKKTNKYDTENAEIFNFIYSAPSNLNNIINDVFNIKEFKYKNINIISDTNVFISKSLLTSHLRLILGNIRKRQNHNYKKNKEDYSYNLSNCELIIKSIKKDDYIILTLEYSNTDKFKEIENENGNLFQFDMELKNFGGSLLDKRLLDNGNYYLEIKLLDYGN